MESHKVAKYGEHVAGNPFFDGQRSLADIAANDNICPHGPYGTGRNLIHIASVDVKPFPDPDRLKNSRNTATGSDGRRDFTGGKYLFFSSGCRTLPNYSEKPITLKEKIKILNQPGHGSEDVFWVSAKIIEDLKPIGLK